MHIHSVLLQTLQALSFHYMPRNPSSSMPENFSAEKTGKEKGEKIVVTAVHVNINSSDGNSRSCPLQ
ncbi:hypothetical protein BVC80_1715g18 [Macleaya cordata]|uniref:Uncharacterized protein n=1 Tax=Macleaya cordata TaxID=56857 RepID=A0A200Q252_MACCD|nr:hypothetical protein BVC80_1715g18 [Macleaya cordata]